MAFKEVNIRDIDKSAVKMISDEWALVTASADGATNSMTVSWGGIGEIWGKDAVFIFIRPQRYTYEFTEKNELFTLSFFGEEYRKALTFCGRNSGRDCDKAKETGLDEEKIKIATENAIISPLTISLVISTLKTLIITEGINKYNDSFDNNTLSSLFTNFTLTRENPNAIIRNN